MRGKFYFLVCIMACLTLLFTLPIIASALTARPPQSNEEGGFAPDPFAEGDALRYGGLFGPLPDPYEYDPLAWLSHRTQIFPRDMGFGVDEPHFIPITKSQSSS